MAYPPGLWIQRFSNPNVTFDFTPTGIPAGMPGEADNALTINQSRVTIANYRQSTIPSVSIADAQGTETDSGTTLLTFNVNLSFAVNQTVTVNFTTSDGSAVAGSDYIPRTGQISFAPGITTVPAAVEVIGDNIGELAESFNVSLLTPTGAVIDDGAGVMTILDDDEPAIAIQPVVFINEGDTGSAFAQFPVTISNQSTIPVRVFYTTATIIAVPGVDYTETSGFVDFPAGSTAPQSIPVEIFGDTADDGLKSFNVNITQVLNAGIANASSVGVIQDDDGPALTITDTTVTEGNSGRITAAFTVGLTAQTPDVVLVNFTTGDDTASEFLGDYVNVAGQLIFPANTTASQTVSVEVNGDTIGEPDEVFGLFLSNPINASLPDPRGDGTILDDDGGQALLSIADASLTEGDAGSQFLQVPVTLSAPVSADVIVDYYATDGTAQGPGDYDQANTFGSLVFPMGTATPQSISVEVFGDIMPEADETFTLTIHLPQNAAISDDTGVCVIRNNDGAVPSLAIGDASITEGDAGSVLLNFPVTISQAVGADATVNWFTNDVSATGGNDYTINFGMVTFPANTTAPQMISVEVFGETIPEPDEIVTISLNAPVNSQIADATGVGTILNDDGQGPTVAVSDAAVIEGDAGVVLASFTVSLTGPNPAGVGVVYATSDVSASVGTDYAFTFGVLNFPAGSTAPQTIDVEVNGDAASEGDESFALNLQTAFNAAITDGLGAGLIRDDDPRSRRVVLHLLGLTTLSLVDGDANGDGVIDAADVAWLVSRGM